MEYKMITLGEILLRLTPPDHLQIQAAAAFEAGYGGSEANVALALSNMGISTGFFTVVPDNPVGKSAVRMLKAYGVDCSQVIFSTPKETPSHRMGVYYLEQGFGIRSSKVIYDRAHSAFAEYDYTNTDIEKLLEGYQWLHVSGITPALGKACQNLIMDCLKKAKEKKMTVSFDGNFRSALWSWQQAQDFCTGCLPYVDVLFGIEPYHMWKNPEQPGLGDIKDELPACPDLEQQNQIFQSFAAQYPNLKCIARHVRVAKSSSENSLMAYLWYRGKTWKSRTITFQILDRVGGGDAFVSGILYGLMKGWTAEKTVNFAVACSAMKHTIQGDVNRIDDVEQILQIMEQQFDIRR